jgi:hypothetical protein
VADNVSRSAARTAALVAIPVGLLAGVLALLVLGNVLGGAAAPDPTTSPGPASTEPVPLAARDLTERQQTACRALLAQLPEQVRDLAQRPVTAGPEQNAAYGDPPITLECGVAEAEYPPTDQVWRLDSVCWHASGDGTRWVTVDREVPVRVTVPDSYHGPGQWAAEFNATIAATLLSADDIPTGCAHP